MLFDECRCTNHNEPQGESCAFIASVRRLAGMKPEEKREAYAHELRARTTEREQQGAVDIPHQLQKLGVPADCIIGLRRSVETKALKWAREFFVASRAEARTLVLAGARGIGKSVAATYVLARAVRGYDWNSQPSGGRPVPPFIWAHAAEVTSATDFGRVDPVWLEGLRECRLLVLDDLGKDASAPGLTALRDVLTHRHERRKATVITSNLGLRELEERYGESWFSRLKVAAIAPVLAGEKSLRARH